jgi:hypothetical protein
VSGFRDGLSPGWCAHALRSFGAERALFPSVWIYNQIRKSDLF